MKPITKLKNIMNYEDNYYKNIFRKEAENIVIPLHETHDIYFLTCTFKNTFKELHENAYLEFFKAFYRNVNNASLNHQSKNPSKKAHLICIPEKSHHCKTNMQKAEHYHCFLMIHKENKNRFFRRAVIGTTYEFYEALQKDVPVQHLHPKMFPKKMFLKAYSLDVRTLEATSDIRGVSGYITKKFGSDDIGPTLHQISDFTKRKTSSSTKRQSHKSFKYDDILIFCDISR